MVINLSYNKKTKGVVFYMKFCTNCGLGVEDNIMFCQRCGYLFAPPPPEQYAPEASVPQPPQYPNYNAQYPPPYPHQYESNDKSVKTSLICGILSIGTFLSMIGGLVFGIIAIIQARIAKKKSYPSTGGMVTGVVGVSLSVLFGVAALIFVVNYTSEVNQRVADYDDTPVRRFDNEEVESERPNDFFNEQIDIDDDDISTDIEDYIEEDPIDPPDTDREDRLRLPDSTDPPVIQESSTRFYTQLTPEQVRSYDTAAFLIIRKVEWVDHDLFGFFTFFTSYDVELSPDGRLIADFDGRLPRVLGSVTGRPGPVEAIEVNRTDTHVYYDVLITLQGTGISGWLEVDLDIQSDEVSVHAMIPIGYLHRPPEERPEIDIFDSSALLFPTYEVIPTLNRDEGFLPLYEWERSGEVAGWVVALDNGRNDDFGFIMDYLDPDYEYYLFFNILDISGNVTSSGITPISLR